MPGGRWKDEETALDRVWSVGITLSRPRSANWIAEEAGVSGCTARSHLDRLIEIGMLEEVSVESSVLFRPDPLYLRLRAMRDLLETHDDLEELRAALEEQMESWQSNYGAESPDSLRRMAVATDTADQTRKLRWIANDWETTQYRLGLVEEAIGLRASGMI